MVQKLCFHQWSCGNVLCISFLGCKVLELVAFPLMWHARSTLNTLCFVCLARKCSSFRVKLHTHVSAVMSVHVSVLSCMLVLHSSTVCHCPFNVYARDHGHLEIACEHKGLPGNNGAANPESILNHPVSTQLFSGWSLRIVLCVDL